MPSKLESSLADTAKQPVAYLTAIPSDFDGNVFALSAKGRKQDHAGAGIEPPSILLSHSANP